MCGRVCAWRKSEGCAVRGASYSYLVEDGEAQRLLLEVLGEVALSVDGEAKDLLEDRIGAFAG